MSRPLIGSQNGCALHGAVATAAAIEGVIPLVHSTPGCALRGAFATAEARGETGAPLNWPPIPSTNLAEKHIVFGGSSRLREEIKNALAVLPSGLLVVITGCPTEMIGDDAPAMVKEATSQGEAVIEVNAAGFLGSAHRGYELLLTALASRLHSLPLREPNANPRLVNLFGVVPRFDPTWVGELDELTRLLASVGLAANPIFGPAGGLPSLAALPRAVANLVLSPWGLAPAHAVASAGAPVVVADGVPVGADQVEGLIRRLNDATGLVAAPDLERLIAAERRYEDFALDETLDGLTRLGRRRAAVVGGGLVAGPIARFLEETLGWAAAPLVLSDEPPDTEPSERVLLTADLSTAATVIREAGADFLIGSSSERALAAELGVPLLAILDGGGRAALTGGFSGARGAGRLLAAIDGASRG